jgi:hypothetical protein
MSTQIAAPAAQGHVATLFAGFELSKSTWLIGLYAPELGSTVSRHKIDGGIWARAVALIETARKRLDGRGKPVSVVSATVFGSIVPSRRLVLRIESSMLQASRWIVGRGDPKPTASISSC